MIRLIKACSASTIVVLWVDERTSPSSARHTASNFLVGTRFIVTRESQVQMHVKEFILKKSGIRSVMPYHDDAEMSDWDCLIHSKSLEWVYVGFAGLLLRFCRFRSRRGKGAGAILIVSAGTFAWRNYGKKGTGSTR
jgi:hypothetical protein